MTWWDPGAGRGGVAGGGFGFSNMGGLLSCFPSCGNNDPFKSACVFCFFIPFPSGEPLAGVAFLRLTRVSAVILSVRERGRERGGGEFDLFSWEEGLHQWPKMRRKTKRDTNKEYKSYLDWRRPAAALPFHSSLNKSKWERERGLGVQQTMAV